VQPAGLQSSLLASLDHLLNLGHLKSNQKCEQNYSSKIGFDCEGQS